jgi:hypothetical protein
MHQTCECSTHCRHIYFHTFVLFVIPLVRHLSPFTVSFISIASHFTIIYNHCSLYFFLYFDSPYVGSAISSVGYTRGSLYEGLRVNPTTSIACYVLQIVVKLSLSRHVVDLLGIDNLTFKVSDILQQSHTRND